MHRYTTCKSYIYVSGRLPIHVNDQNSAPTNYNANDPVSGFSAIPRNMTGIAEKMKGAGYATHQVGKCIDI